MMLLIFTKELMAIFANRLDDFHKSISKKSAINSVNKKTYRWDICRSCQIIKVLQVQKLSCESLKDGIRFRF